MKLADLPDIDFVEVDSNEIQEAVFEAYTNITGRTLAKGDPIRLFLLFEIDVIIRLLNKINYTGKQNLLKYSEGDNLDNLAANAWVTRLAADSARTTLQATLSAVRDSETIIPKGTRVSPESGVYFATDSDCVIPAGETNGTVTATCTVAGTSGNDYRVGEISKIVDPVAFVDTLTNITKSEGGSDTETDSALRERVWEAPEALSVAGPTGAYKARTKAVNSSIVDVNINSPSPGVVQIVPLLTGGKLPDEELLKEVYIALSADTVRPLTDKVETVAPTPINYDIDVEYYIDTGTDAVRVQTQVATAIQNFTEWEKNQLGRDINPSKLVQLLMDVSGVKRVNVNSPVFTVVTDTQVAIASGIKVVMVGSEDE